MVRHIGLLIALIIVGLPPISPMRQAAAQDIPHSPAQDRACRADARRFCRDVMPDQFRVASCLQEHRAQVSRRCRSVLEGRGT